MTAAKTTPSANQDQPRSGMLFTILAMVACFVVATLVYSFVFGAAHHFVDGDNSKDPLPGDYYGTISMAIINSRAIILRSKQFACPDSIAQ